MVTKLVDMTQDRPLARGDVLRLLDKRFERTSVWIIQRIQLHVFCLGNKTGILLENDAQTMWITFPHDPDFEIVERLAN